MRFLNQLNQTVTVQPVKSFNNNILQYNFFPLAGNLQRPKEVFEAGLRGRVLRPRQHGHHGRLVHTQRHQRRRGLIRIFLYLRIVTNFHF